MQTIRARLSLSYFLVLVLGMALAGVLAWLTVEGLYLHTQRQNLLAQASLIASTLQGAVLPTEPVQPYSQIANAVPGVHTRILSEAGGIVVGLPLEQAFTQMPAAEQHAAIPTSELLQRSEIQSALNGSPGTAVRRVLGNQRVLYAAAPVYTTNGQISGIVYIATPLPAAGLPTNVILQLSGATLLAMLLATFAGSLLARRIAQPLEGLASAATAISKGDLKQRVERESNIRELRSLAGTFNDMAESLHQADEAKKAFIADVTHELRTPLTVIKGTIETLEDGALDDAEGRGPLLTSMQRETDRLIRLVNELLVLTRADAGSLQLDLQALDLGEMARARCEVFARLAASKGIQFGVRELAPVSNASKLADSKGHNAGKPADSRDHNAGKPADSKDYNASKLADSKGHNAGKLADSRDHNAGKLADSKVLADADRLSQILDNLLDNAIRHSPQNSRITISLQPVNAGVECSVADQGPGISAQHLPFIFERFYRIDPSRNRRDGGTGLGLAIVRALVKAQGGEIRAESVEGEGTKIGFWLPAS